MSKQWAIEFVLCKTREGKNLAGSNFYLNLVESVRSKRDRLSSDSHVRNAVADAMLELLTQRSESSSELDLDYAKWPPVFSFLEVRRPAQVAELDGDIDLVLGKTAVDKRAAGSHFLGAGAKDPAAIEEVFENSPSYPDNEVSFWDMCGETESP